MEHIQNTVTLNNGCKMPIIGMGTYKLEKDSLSYSIKNLGYRLIDTAFFYKNEDMVGEVLEDVFTTTNIKRDEITVITKIWPT